MGDADQPRRWRSAQAELRGALAVMRPAIDASFAAAADEYLDHNELGLAMDVLVEAGITSPPDALPDGVIQKLGAASAQMDGYLPENWPEFSGRFGRRF